MIVNQKENKNLKARDWLEYSSEILDLNYNNFLKGECKRLRKNFSRYYLQVDDLRIKENNDLIKKFLQDNKVYLVVPMKEIEDTIKNLLNYATKKLPSNSIIVINDGSSKKAVEAVKKFKNVIIIDKNEILSLINWKKLFKILNINKKPKGKGVAVMSAYLFVYLLKKLNNENKIWIFQTDADIRNHYKFKALEYLTYGIIHNPKSVYVKIAKGGRNNECHMAVRSSLVMLEDLNQVIENEKAFKIAKRSRQLFENLAKYKWILGGTFAIYDELIFSRPFASGYLEETLISAFVEDWIIKNGGASVQVSNPNYCSDGSNSFIKENTIVQMTANFVITLALFEKMVCDWNLDDILWINKNLMNRPKPIALIPHKKEQGPVIVKIIGNERIIPSIKMLDENDFIDWNKAKKFLKRKMNFCYN